uniref:DOMON domain-containing protein n=1 Tax=Romanomermis culicivorax TaxID=13658 RepID=A0A915IET2_ROMCU
MKNVLSSSLVVILTTFVYSTKSQCNYSSQDGRYKVSWFLDKDSPSMSGGDLIIVSTVGDAVSVTDRHGVGFAEPAIDAQQNIQIIKASVQNGQINVEFTRAIDTGDAEDVPLKDAAAGDCQQFIFPESGGKAASLQSIRKHLSTPMKKQICHIEKCTFDGQIVGTTGNKSGRPFGLLPQRSGPKSGPEAKKSAEEATTVGRALNTEVVSDKAAGNANHCPPRKDHQACKKYVDNYLDMVFTTFERNAANFQKACNLLIAQQQGLVNRECCNYLSKSDVCQQFMKPS